MAQSPKTILKKYWNFDEFRPPQEEIIKTVLSGKDCLALLPTGGGKSICFQIPALLGEGITLVISPLIALMKDQVNNLQKKGIEAQAIYSGMHYKEIDRILDNCIYGKTKLLYVSPERLHTDVFKSRFASMKVDLIAVDEAHCISQWGYDFRPAYLRISEIRDLHPNTPILALTATATNEVVEDIQDKLNFREKKLIRKSFFRENLSFSMLKEDDKDALLIHLINRIPGSALIYVRSRANTRSIVRFLHQHKISADFYHAGLNPERRNAVQENWLSGKTRLIVCTNAFGMGIDKPDVRLVIHYDLVPSPEEYYQEAGRAGRDGEKAWCILLYNEKDMQMQTQFLELSFPSQKETQQIYKSLAVYFNQAIGSGAGESFDFDIESFCERYNLEKAKTFYALKQLEQGGYIHMSESVFNPARLQIIANKEDLYRYQIENPEADRLIKIILRLYEGLFNAPVFIRASRIAEIAKMDKRKVEDFLARLQRDNLAKYTAEKTEPQLTYLIDRLPDEHLIFDEKMISFRKDAARKRIDSMIRLVEGNSCRNQEIMAYFNEKMEAACGQCDICLGSKNREVSPSELKKFQSRIESLLEIKSRRLNEILFSFPINKKAQLLAVLEYLENEEIVEIKNDYLRLVKK